MEIFNGRFHSRLQNGGGDYRYFRHHGFSGRICGEKVSYGYSTWDKLTQIAIVCALSVRFEWFAVVACLLIVKEGFMGIMGYILIRRGKMLNGARWFGKVSTAVLYVIMFALILIPDINMDIANGMILVSGILLTLSLILYIPEYRKILKE